MQIQKLKSSKLFYNKWPYKIECSINGACRITILGIEKSKDWCNGLLSVKPFWIAGNSSATNPVNKLELLAFIKAVEPFIIEKEYVQVRAEGRHFNIFCKDRVLLDNICIALNHWIIGVSGPTTDAEYEFLIANGHKKILCDNLPKDNYRFRIYLNPKWPGDKRLSFYQWAAKYNNAIIIADSTKKWLTSDRKWTYTPFMYVKDDKMSTMIGLYASGYIKKVEEFILRENLVTA